jgi:hypothetical protein
VLAGKQDRMNWLNRIVVRCDCNLAGIRNAAGPSEAGSGS